MHGVLFVLFLFFGGGGDALSPTPGLIPLTSAALPTGMHPCSPVQRLREVCVLMMLPSLQERHEEVSDARWEPSPGRYKQHHFPLSALKSAAGT